VTLMEFESLPAVRQFAGDDYEAAVVPPNARAVLARFDARSQHYDLRVPRAAGPAAPVAEVDAIRHLSLRWTAAVAAGDLAALSALMSYDVVVVHGDGRTLLGRDAVLADLASSLGLFQVDQRVTFIETVVEGPVAFDHSRVHTTVSARQSGDRRESDSQVFTILKRDPRRGWLVARSMGVVELASAEPPARMRGPETPLDVPDVTRRAEEDQWRR